MAKKIMEKFSLGFLNKKLTLYLVSLISGILLISRLMSNDLISVLLFYLVTGFVFLYTKNMSVILLVSCIITFSYLFYKKSFSREGLENQDQTQNPVSKKKVTPKDIQNEDDSEDSDSEDLDNYHRMPETALEEDIIEHYNDNPLDSENVDDIAAQKKSLDDLKNISSSTTEGYGNKKQVRKGFQNNKPLDYSKIKHTPPKNNIPSKLNKNLTKADEMEAAYDNFEKVMGKDNIKSLGDTTTNLISKQKELLGGIKEMAPVLEKAMDVLNKFDFSSFTQSN